MNKNWNIFIAISSILLFWQYTMIQNVIKQYNIHSVSMSQKSQPTNHILLAQNPEQKIQKAYKSAKFLAVIDTNKRVKYNNKDLFCLAKNIFHEAGNQSDKGKFAVAQVTMNRTTDPNFSGTVCEVVYAANQFSWTRSSRLKSSHPSGKEWDDSMRIAAEVLGDGKRVKGMENVLYYHADYVHPHWKHVTRLAQIGAHIFYNKA
jgi:spore germination cell wall hydrolase CwlJ-like protein